MKINKKTKKTHTAGRCVATMAALVSSFWLESGMAEPLPRGLPWTTVVNNLDDIPGTSIKFNSYNQPSVNARGHLVFRARSAGGGITPVSGLFLRDLMRGGEPLAKITERSATVPHPNNTTYPPDDLLASFNEFPSIPRIAMNSPLFATRGNSQPVWTYSVGDEESRVGTTGIFYLANGMMETAVNQLGIVPEPASPVVGENFFPHFVVPGASPGTKFDVFPGSPSITDESVVVFKGNYTDGDSKTGVFFRDLRADGGLAPVQLIANSDTIIPNLPKGVEGIPFDSTAPPSAHGGMMVFVGYDNEDDPTYGGIYLAELSPNPPLTTLVGVGDPVPGEPGETFTQFGEALSFEGRYVAFWAAWGEEKRTLWLDCPADGNRDRIAYCEEFVGDDFPVEVPVHQGIFVHDTWRNETRMMARTGDGIDDFLFWNFSGRPPGVGEGDEEDAHPPRWRSSAFVAVSAGIGDTAYAAFKTRTGNYDPMGHEYLEPVDAIVLSDGTESQVLLDTTMDGQDLDPDAPAGSVITTLALERESFRGRWLAVSASMVDEVTTEGLAGIYASRINVRPDVHVGRSINLMSGNNAYGERPRQRVDATSRAARRVGFVIGVENDGDLTDAFRIQGRRGGRYFRVAYFRGGNNITSLILRGRYWTGAMVPGAPLHRVRMLVKPNRSRIYNAYRSGDRQQIRIASRNLFRVRSTSALDPSEADSGFVHVRVPKPVTRKQPRPTKPVDRFGPFQVNYPRGVVPF